MIESQTVDGSWKPIMSDYLSLFPLIQGNVNIMQEREETA